MARGRDEIRPFVMGTEMDGLDKWSYPYVRTVIDDQKGEIIGIWRQLAPITGDDGQPVEIAGTGGSWFRYAGEFHGLAARLLRPELRGRRLPGSHAEG